MRPILRPVCRFVDGQWAWSGCILLVIGLALYSAEQRAEGGDLWIAFQNGRHAIGGDWATQDSGRTWQMKVLDRAGIHLTFRDPFSAKSRPYDPSSLTSCGWINQNWLSHVLLYKMRTAFGDGEDDVAKGETLIVIHKYLQIMLIALLMYATARVLGVHPLIGAVATASGLFVGRSFFDMRPNTSSFVLAGIMMLILAAWSRRSERGTILYWMIPVVMLWANMHGGFVYVLMVLPTVCILVGLGNCLHGRWPDRFAHRNRSKVRNLVVCTALIFAVAAVLNPFGVRNLCHPLLLALGQDAEVFREIAEWQPLWKQGFGPTRPYLLFLSSLGAASVVWLAAWIGLRPRPPASGCTSKDRADHGGWPSIDVAQIGVVALTVVMGIKARRFIPLAAVVAAPFLGQVIQQIVRMVCRGGSGTAREILFPQRRRALASLMACLSMTAGLWLFVGGCKHTKRLLAVPSDDSSPFGRMAMTEQHPAGAAKFVNGNKIAGTVLNEWIDGGFIAFHQTPDPATGEPRCKVFVDGRSQAAYDGRHCTFWQVLNSVPGPTYDQDYEMVEAEARRRSLEPTDMAFVEHLTAEYLKGRGNYPNEDEYRKTRGHLEFLLNLALSNPVVFDKTLRREGINVALLPLTARADYELYNDRLPHWKLVYLDDKHSVFLREGCCENGGFWARDPAELVYPDDFSRKMSVGLRYCQCDDAARRKEGVRLLMSIDRTLLRQYTSRREFVPGLTDHILEHGVKADMHDEIAAYLAERAWRYERPSGDATSRLRIRALIDVYSKRADLAVMNWDYDKARKYIGLARAYRRQAAND